MDGLNDSGSSEDTLQRALKKHRQWKAKRKHVEVKEVRVEHAFYPEGLDGDLAWTRENWPKMSCARWMPALKKWRLYE